jgi:hypothetical protein
MREYYRQGNLQATLESAAERWPNPKLMVAGRTMGNQKFSR